MVVSPRLTLPRSFLYVPGDRRDLIAKALAGPSDAIIIDLEDAVAADHKTSARETVAAMLCSRAGSAPAGRRSGPEIWVRVDSDALEADLDAVVRDGLDGLVLAKCSAESLATAGSLLAEQEQRRALPSGALPIIGLIESASALLQLEAMAGHPRLATFGVGEVDLLADLRIRRGTGTAAVIDALRLQIVVECAAAGCAPPVAPTSTDFRDLEAFSASTRLLSDLGFRSRTAIHPAQVPIIQNAFQPDPDELAAARALIARLDEAGGGVATDHDGRLIDAAVVRAAHETLARADAWPTPTPTPPQSPTQRRR